MTKDWGLNENILSLKLEISKFTNNDHYNQ